MRFFEHFFTQLRHVKIDFVEKIFFSAHHCFVKLAWTSALAALTSCCVYLIVGSVSNYLQYNVTTTYRLISEQQQQGVAFPSVYFCDSNPFNSAMASQLLGNLDLQRLIASVLVINEMDFLLNLARYNYIMIALQAQIKQMTGSYMSNQNEQSFSELDRMLVGCRFGTTTCNASDFTWFYHPTFINCYIFNAGGTRKVSTAGLMSGDARLFLQLNASVREPMTNRMPFRGFYVATLNASESPMRVSPSAHLVVPGTGALISIERSFFTEYESPYSGCTVSEKGELTEPLEDARLFEQTRTLSNYSYTQRDCLNVCAQLYIAAECNCTLATLDFSGNTWCTSTSDNSCAITFYRLNFTTGNFIKENCMSRCPLECSRSVLTATMSLYKTSSTTSNDIAEVVVYYDRLAYTVVNEVPKITLENLIGSIGGNLHIFLGMSMMSLVELIELFVHFNISLMKKKRFRSSQTKKQLVRSEKSGKY